MYSFLGLFLLELERQGGDWILAKRLEGCFKQEAFAAPELLNWIQTGVIMKNALPTQLGQLSHLVLVGLNPRHESKKASPVKL